MEYVSNLYLREYVSGFLTAEGWIVVVVAVVAALGSLTVLFLKRPLKSVEPVETVSTEAMVPVELPRVAVQSKERSEAGFHPAVAALLADISGRRSSFQATPARRVEEPKTELMTKEGSGEDQATGLETDLFRVQTAQRMFEDRSLAPQPDIQVGEAGEADRPVVAEPAVRASPSLPRNVTTVITGIIPAQKKKPNSSDKEGTSS